MIKTQLLFLLYQMGGIAITEPFAHTYILTSLLFEALFFIKNCKSS